MSGTRTRLIVRTLALVCILSLGGCAGLAREAVNIPFEMAKHAAARTATLPLEVGQIGAQRTISAVMDGVK